jgi:hypothetical protein
VKTFPPPRNHPHGRESGYLISLSLSLTALGFVGAHIFASPNLSNCIIRVLTQWGATLVIKLRERERVGCHPSPKIKRERGEREKREREREERETPGRSRKVGFLYPAVHFISI